MNNQHETWSTSDEIIFLKGIGTYTTNSPNDKGNLLRKYLEVVENRAVWGQINKAKVIEFAVKELNKL